MIGRTPRRGDRDSFVAETRHGGLPGADNFTTLEWTAEGAGGRTVDLLPPSASGREPGCDPTVAEGSPAAGRFCAAGELLGAMAVARRCGHASTRTTVAGETPPVPRGARDMGGADRAQARRAEHGPGVGILVLIAVA